LSYKGLIEFSLVRHDPELSELTLRNWLEIVDQDRLARFMAKGLVLRACRAWMVERLHELAAALGVNWIWSNETERSANYREWPPMANG
jgi:hypothetical protein